MYVHPEWSKIFSFIAQVNPWKIEIYIIEAEYRTFYR